MRVADADAVARCLRARHSCRRFRPEAVRDAAIQEILELAQKAPSWCNVQPWHVIVTRGTATRLFSNALLEHATASPLAPDIAFPNGYVGVFKERRRDCAMQLYDAAGIPRGDRAASAQQAKENYRFFGAPHVAIVTVEARLGSYAAVDCGAYVATFLVAAQALGVATIAQASLASFAPFVRQYFGIPDGQHVLCGISFGYEDTDHPVNRFRTPRASLAQVCGWRD